MPARKRKYTRICENCGKSFMSTKPNGRFCCRECNTQYNDNKGREERYKKYLETGTEGVDYIIDLWNGLPTPRIYGKWIKNMHPGKTIEDYKNEFPDAPIHCSKDKENVAKGGKHIKSPEERKKLSIAVKGEKNPNHKSKTTEQQRKERSPFSKEFYNKRNLSENDRDQFNKKIAKVRSYNTTLEYYTNKGYSEIEARELLHNRQKTNTVQSYIKKYGEELGIIKFKERNKIWSINIESRYKTNEFSKMPKTFGLISSEKEKQLIKDIINSIDINEFECYWSESPNKQLCLFDETKKRNLYYDFCYKNKIIEFNGDFWHQNPQIYESTNVNTINNMTAESIWKKDKEKIELANKLGYEVLIIWESEYTNNIVNTIQKCKEFILS